MKTARWRYVVILGVLACWHASAIAALGLGLHLLLADHHGPHEAHHQSPPAASHGHHHDFEVAERDHAAVAPRDLAVAQFRVLPAQAVELAGGLELPPVPAEPSQDRPPDLIHCRFYEHCALLL